MRIIGGTHRGLKLAEVGAGDAAAHLRPSSDRLREALFNLLTQGRLGDRVRGARVLDLFAGTGALGLEALSRGAAQVTFVETGAAARALIRANVEKMRAMGATRLYRRDATDLGPTGGRGSIWSSSTRPTGRGWASGRWPRPWPAAGWRPGRWWCGRRRRRCCRPRASRWWTGGATGRRI
jgi:16S rRNA (guanine966-N2)-methyltransferase